MFFNPVLSWFSSFLTDFFFFAFSLLSGVLIGSVCQGSHFGKQLFSWFTHFAISSTPWTDDFQTYNFTCVLSHGFWFHIFYYIEDIFFGCLVVRLKYDIEGPFLALKCKKKIPITNKLWPLFQVAMPSIEQVFHLHVFLPIPRLVYAYNYKEIIFAILWGFYWDKIYI